MGLHADRPLPSDLPHGDVYRVLPGKQVFPLEFPAFTRPGQPAELLRSVPNPVDGDGLVMRLHVDSGADGHPRMTYVARYVDSLFHRIEERQGRGIFQSYSFRPDLSGLWRDPKKLLSAVLGRLMSKGTYNTGILPLQNKVVPLVEDHAAAYAMDPKTLETHPGGLRGVPGLGPKTFALTNQTITAHPKFDPSTGRTFLYGVVPAEAPFMGLRLGVVEGDTYHHCAFVRPSRLALTLPEHTSLPRAARAALERVGVRFGGRKSLDYFPQPHELAVAGKLLAIPFLPIRVDLDRIEQAGPEKALSWAEDQPTELVFVDKDSFAEVARVELHPPIAAFHWPWGRQLDDEHVELVTIVHQDLQSALGEGLEEAVRGDVNGANIGGQLVKLTIDLRSRTVEQTVLSSVPVELPTTDRRFEGHDADRLYCVAAADGAGYMNAIQSYDVTQSPGEGVQMYRFPEGHVVSEATFMPADQGGPGEGYLVTVVHRSPKDGSPAGAYVAILDARAVDEGPVSVLELPDAVGFGLHTAFAPAR